MEPLGRNHSCCCWNRGRQARRLGQLVTRVRTERECRETSNIRHDMLLHSIRPRLSSADKCLDSAIIEFLTSATCQNSGLIKPLVDLEQ